MKRIEIDDTTVMGIAGQGELLTLAIFLKDPIELAMSLHVAQVIKDILGQAIDKSEGVSDRKTLTDSEKQMEISVMPDGRIAFGFGDRGKVFTDEEAMKIAQTIARILRHKQSQARTAT